MKFRKNRHFQNHRYQNIPGRAELSRVDNSITRENLQKMQGAFQNFRNFRNPLPELSELIIW
ncbi:MAG: hypothetical protein DYG96_08355 [Chlorobi bacterium CHB2]|nr:hypothetical protein [Chlorobi bacterium CHB2]